MHANSTFFSSKKTLLAIVGTTVLLTSGFSNAAKTEYPLTIKNCGRDITFNQAPTRVATVGQNSTEILYSLGLADRVVGTSLWFGPVLDAYKAANEKVAVIAQNIPSFELWLKNQIWLPANLSGKSALLAQLPHTNSLVN